MCCEPAVCGGLGEVRTQVAWRVVASQHLCALGMDLHTYVKTSPPPLLARTPALYIQMAGDHGEEQTEG